MLRLILLLAFAFALVCLSHPRAEGTSSCGGDALQPSLIEQEIMLRTNAYREQMGMHPLWWDPRLQRMAVWKAQANAALGGSAHDDGFRSWEQRFRDCQIPAMGWWGENLAAGQQSAAEVVGDWQESPSHNENLLRSEFLATGVAVVHGGPPYYWYYAQEFGP